MWHMAHAGGLALLVVLLGMGCGGSGGSSSGSPTAPSVDTSAVVIAIVGDRGNQSFQPNPATASRGTMIAWRNNDSVVHRIRFNDGSLETADILPGQTSAPRQMPTDGANYHCTIHPGMIGAINSSSGEPPPCTGIYCE